MNKDNILAVADAIEQHRFRTLGFNMWNYFSTADKFTPDRTGHDCGTVACIAGWTAAVRNGRAIKKWSADDWPRVVKFLDLTVDEADRLFIPDVKDWSAVTPVQAVTVLRHLAETGEVDWSVAS